MTYSTLMVHLQADQLAAGLLEIANSLAQRLGAGMIGIAARRPMDMTYNDGYVPAEIVQQNREQLEAELAAAEAVFRHALTGRVRSLQWRSAITYGPLSDYLAHEARSADLIITGIDGNASVFDTANRVGVGNLVMQAGRPTLVVPASVGKLVLEHVLVGWKDTKETRRAISDALPLLRLAARVTVLEIAPTDEVQSAMVRLRDVVDWLNRHGIEANSIASSSGGNDTKQIHDIVQEQGADLIVAGAYGHSRVREWVLGGVTRDLLLRGKTCALLSH